MEHSLDSSTFQTILWHHTKTVYAPHFGITCSHYKANKALINKGPLQNLNSHIKLQPSNFIKKGYRDTQYLKNRSKTQNIIRKCLKLNLICPNVNIFLQGKKLYITLLPNFSLFIPERSECAEM